MWHNVSYEHTSTETTDQLERGPTPAGVGTGQARLEASQDCRGIGCERRSGLPMAQTGTRRRPGGVVSSATADQRAALPSLLAQGAPAFGFVGDLWTNPRIAALIEREFGVRYHPAHISRLLREIGWTSQKPTTRATQRDEEAITRWETERW